MRNLLFTLGGVFVILFIVSPLLPFVLNTTPSMPRGLYYTYSCLPERGDLVQFRLPDRNWNFALERGYISKRTEGLLKEVVAVSGDRVCWRDDGVFVDDILAGSVSEHDSKGRPLGHVEECTSVPQGYLLPIAPDSDKSYDGRYFGLVSVATVQDCLRPLWTE